FALRPPPASVPAAYAQNTEEEPGSCRGTLFLANDGGVYRSPDCGRTWNASRFLQTLAGAELAGIPVANRPSALYFGTQDNDSWVSLDGGVSWRRGFEPCGDCAGYFADPLKPDLVVHFKRFLPWDSRYVLQIHRA